MAKFHINDKGDAGLCSAAAGRCPFGGEAQHYASKENAQKAFEMSMAANHFPEVRPRAYQQPILSLEERAYRNSKFVKAVGRQRLSNLTSAEARDILHAVDSARLGINGEQDGFSAAEDLAKNMNGMNEFFTKNLSEEVFSAAKSASFSYIAPHVSSASNAFEDELAEAGWDTRGSDTAKDKFSFERIFVQAVKISGVEGSSKDLMEAFKEVAQADKNWDIEESVESDEALSKASVKARRMINRGLKGFGRELKQLP